MIETVAALVIFLFPLAYSPGPGNLFFAANGARFGFRATLRAILGYHVATWIVTAAIGLGFVGVMNRAPWVFVVLKYGGSFYVFWIAWKLVSAGILNGLGEAKPARFRDGVVLLILNPKAYVIIALMFSQFLGQFNIGRSISVFLITTVFTVNNLIAFVIWTRMGDRISAPFRCADSARYLNVMLGMSLAAVAAWMILP